MPSRHHFYPLNKCQDVRTFVSIAAWASDQRSNDEMPYWRTLKANGELNAKYPGGVEAQKEKLEAEGHIVIQKCLKIRSKSLSHIGGFSLIGRIHLFQVRNVIDL